MRRRKLPPDKRLNWRDPDMPVLRPAMAPGDKVYKPYEWEAKKAFKASLKKQGFTTSF